MIDDVVVVDAVLHGFNWLPNDTGMAPGRIYDVGHRGFSSKIPKYADYILSPDQVERRYTAEEVVSCVFEESWTDLGVYHHIRAMGRGNKPKDAEESSPLSVGLEVRDLAPGRVFLYGYLTNPFDHALSFDEIDRFVDEYHMIGLKFYPHDLDPRTGKVEPFQFDDEAVAFPLIEHARKRGIKVMAVHKAMGSRIKLFGVQDVERAAVAFPDMNFEIVHAGYAFLDDTTRVALLPNVYLNLENTSALVAVAPRRFGEIMGRFLDRVLYEPDAADRIVWASGATLVHPQPLLELFWDYQIPEDLIEGYGWRQLTKDIKRKILGENFARMHGLDLDVLVKAIPMDEMRRKQLAGELAPPWSKVPPAAA